MSEWTSKQVQRFLEFVNGKNTNFPWERAERIMRNAEMPIMPEGTIRVEKIAFKKYPNKNKVATHLLVAPSGRPCYYLDEAVTGTKLRQISLVYIDGEAETVPITRGEWTGCLQHFGFGVNDVPIYGIYDGIANGVMIYLGSERQILISMRNISECLQLSCWSDESGSLSVSYMDKDGAVRIWGKSRTRDFSIEETITPGYLEARGFVVECSIMAGYDRLLLLAKHRTDDQHALLAWQDHKIIRFTYLPTLSPYTSKLKACHVHSEDIYIVNTDRHGMYLVKGECWESLFTDKTSLTVFDSTPLRRASSESIIDNQGDVSAYPWFPKSHNLKDIFAMKQGMSLVSDCFLAENGRFCFYGVSDSYLFLIEVPER